MKRTAMLCLVLAMLLALGGGQIAAGETVPAEPSDGAPAEVEIALEGAVMDGEAAILSPEGEAAVRDLGDGERNWDETALRALFLPDEVTLGVRETLCLQPAVEPAGAVCRLAFSSGGSCASVTEDGLVTALKQGEDTVTVTADNGVTASVKVLVKAAPKKVTLRAEQKRLRVGETEQLDCALPGDAAGSLTFSVGDDSVLNVTPEGLVTALSPGTAQVTVTAYNGKKDSVKLTVMPAFEVTFMNIGRNDGILIQCDGEYAFIDSGMRGRGQQAARYMKRQEVPELRYYIGTHAHKDHVGGGPAIMAAIQTREVIVSHAGAASAIKRYATGSAERKAVKQPRYRVVKRGETFPLGSAEFKVLGPVKVVKCKADAVAENGNSLILRLTYGENTFLLTGDATGSELTQVHKANPGCLRAQVLKNPHHYGRQDYIVRKCKPEITVISTSRDSLPTSSYVSFIKRQGSKVYITSPNRDGHVTIASDGKELMVTTQK